MQALMFLGLATYMGLSVERIETLRKTPVMPDGADTGKITNYDIEFQNIDFSYNHVPVIKQLNLKIPSHKTHCSSWPFGFGENNFDTIDCPFLGRGQRRNPAEWKKY